MILIFMYRFDFSQIAINKENKFNNGNIIYILGKILN